jgi:molybdate transport system substrate-binding protein
MPAPAETKEDGGAISVLSSMATRAVLAELTSVYASVSGTRVVLESVGGVDAAKRVAAGEQFDLVVLARDAIDKLSKARHLMARSEVDLLHSFVAVAVRAGAPGPSIASEEALKRAVLEATTIGYSTGPSGVQVAQLFASWGIEETIRERIVIPAPGIPVAALIAGGQVALGFQQLSELLHVEGVELLGTLPAPLQIVTTFSGAVATRAAHPEKALALLAFLASEDTADTKRRQGLEPAGCGGAQEEIG